MGSASPVAGEPGVEAVIQNLAPVKHALETEKYCGGHEEDGNQHNDHLQVQPDKFEHRPQEEEAKGETLLGK